MNVRRIGRAPTWVALAALTVAGLVSLPPTAHAAGPVGLEHHGGAGAQPGQGRRAAAEGEQRLPAIVHQPVQGWTAGSQPGWSRPA